MQKKINRPINETANYCTSKELVYSASQSSSKLLTNTTDDDSLKELYRLYDALCAKAKVAEFALKLVGLKS